MSNVLLNIGYGNMVAVARVISIVSPQSAPMKRLREADREIEAISGFDYAVRNDDLDACVDDLVSIVRAERSGIAAEIDALRDKFSPRKAEERFGGPS